MTSQPGRDGGDKPATPGVPGSRCTLSSQYTGTSTRRSPSQGPGAGTQVSEAVALPPAWLLPRRAPVGRGWGGCGACSARPLRWAAAAPWPVYGPLVTPAAPEPGPRPTLGLCPLTGGHRTCVLRHFPETSMRQRGSQLLLLLQLLSRVQNYEGLCQEEVLGQVKTERQGHRGGEVALPPPAGSSQTEPPTSVPTGGKWGAGGEGKQNQSKCQPRKCPGRPCSLVSGRAGSEEQSEMSPRPG